MIKALMNIVENFLTTEPSSDDYIFFDDLEYIIFCNIDKFNQEDPLSSSILYDDVMDVCSKVEYKGDCRWHRACLKEISDSLKMICATA